MEPTRQADQPTAQVRSNLNRQVFVENIMNEEYAEEFKGDVIVVPPSGKIVMPVMEANKFVGQFKAPLKKDHSGQWKRVQGPKPLRVVEMTAEDREALEGVTPAQQKAAEKAEEDKARLKCMKCGFVAQTDKGLKIHATAIHGTEE